MQKHADTVLGLKIKKKSFYNTCSNIGSYQHICQSQLFTASCQESLLSPLLVPFLETTEIKSQRCDCSRHALLLFVHTAKTNAAIFFSFLEDSIT